MRMMETCGDCGNLVDDCRCADIFKERMAKMGCSREKYHPVVDTRTMNCADPGEQDEIVTFFNLYLSERSLKLQSPEMGGLVIGEMWALKQAIDEALDVTRRNATPAP